MEASKALVENEFHTIFFRINHESLVSEIQERTALYFCKAVPHAAVFIVVFQVYVNYFILKSNYNEFDEKPFFEVTRNWLNFRLRSFLYQGTL